MNFLKFKRKIIFNQIGKKIGKDIGHVLDLDRDHVPGLDLEAEILKHQKLNMINMLKRLI